MFLVVACVTAVATAGACERSTSANPPAPTGAGGTKPSCGVAPASLVSSTLGVTVGEPQETDNGRVVTCLYAPGADSSAVTVRFQTGTGAAEFTAGRQGFASTNQPTTDVPGFADEAYSSTLGSGAMAVNTLVARRGELEILVSSSASIDAEKALIQRLLDALA